MDLRVGGVNLWVPDLGFLEVTRDYVNPESFYLGRGVSATKTGNTYTITGEAGESVDPVGDDETTVPFALHTFEIVATCP